MVMFLNQPHLTGLKCQEVRQMLHKHHTFSLLFLHQTKPTQVNAYPWSFSLHSFLNEEHIIFLIREGDCHNLKNLSKWTRCNETLEIPKVLGSVWEILSPNGICKQMSFVLLFLWVKHEARQEGAICIYLQWILQHDQFAPTEYFLPCTCLSCWKRRKFMKVSREEAPFLVPGPEVSHIPIWELASSSLKLGTLC